MNYMQDLWGETSIRHSLPEESIAMGVFFKIIATENLLYIRLSRTLML